MIERTAIDNMRDFINIIYYDKSKDKGCVLEEWNREKGSVKIRYSDGSDENYNETVIPSRMIELGRFRDYKNEKGLFMHLERYWQLDDNKKKIFCKTIEDAVRIFKKNE